ncbi:hypothetical protein B0T20DRAFT_399778 [Sordaria brevicollis]|uniref:Uncharacterized protein n=1 Tax=Sordaria brevicollis TaxID=83679 RepID=A0AAE0PN32_SORBR|nr:hypothetical protein B0T20DRAFT_399778 [Sordaria brevicollis]
MCCHDNIILSQESITDGHSLIPQTRIETTSCETTTPQLRFDQHQPTNKRTVPEKTTTIADPYAVSAMDQCRALRRGMRKEEKQKSTDRSSTHRPNTGHLYRRTVGTNRSHKHIISLGTRICPLSSGQIGRLGVVLSSASLGVPSAKEYCMERWLRGFPCSGGGPGGWKLGPGQSSGRVAGFSPETPSTLNCPRRLPNPRQPTRPHGTCTT